MKHFLFPLFLFLSLPVGIFAQDDTKSPRDKIEAMGEGSREIGPASSSAMYELALGYNDVLDTCTRTGCANIDELMEFFADDAVRTFVGRATQVGKEAIRQSYIQRAHRLQQVVEVKGIDVWGDLVVCRMERRDTNHTRVGREHHVRVLLVKGGKIKHLIVIVDPEEDESLRAREG